MSLLTLRGGCALASVCTYNLPPKLSPKIFIALEGAPVPTAPPGYARVHYTHIGLSFRTVEGGCRTAVLITETVH